eukprot:gene12419-biopygen4771
MGAADASGGEDADGGGGGGAAQEHGAGVHGTGNATDAGSPGCGPFWMDATSSMLSSGQGGAPRAEARGKKTAS